MDWHKLTNLSVRKQCFYQNRLKKRKQTGSGYLK